IDQDLAQIEQGHVVYRAGLLAELRRRDLVRAGAALAGEIGLPMPRPSRDHGSKASIGVRLISRAAGLRSSRRAGNSRWFLGVPCLNAISASRYRGSCARVRFPGPSADSAAVHRLPSGQFPVAGIPKSELTKGMTRAVVRRAG